MTRTRSSAFVLKVATVLAVAGTASTLYQLSREQLDRRRHPAPGSLIDVAGRRLHLWRDDDAAGPVCVVVTALGTACVEWRPFQQRMHGKARLWLYDRGGLGWSGPADGAVRTVGVLADELADLLEAAQADEPVIVIGHSVGGIVARDFACRYPGRVAGLLLVDSSHELMWDRLPGLEHWRRDQWATVARRRLTWYGVRRALDDLGWRRIDRTSLDRFYRPEWHDAAFTRDATLAQRRARIAERLGMLRGFVAAHARRHPLGDLPVTVLTAGPDGGDRRRQTWTVWKELQADIAGQADQAVHTVVEDGEHHLHLHRPEASRPRYSTCSAE